MTQSPKTRRKKRRVTFALPDSDCEEESESPTKPRLHLGSSASPKGRSSSAPRFSPPPLDADLKVRSILKKTKQAYEEVVLTPSFLPLYIINSVINSKFGPDIPDSFEDSESDSAGTDVSEDSDSLTENLFTLNQNNLDLECKSTIQSSPQSSFDENCEESLDFWCVNSEDKNSEDSGFVYSPEEQTDQEHLDLISSLNEINVEISSDCLSKDLDTSFDPESESSCDVSESTDNSDQAQEFNCDKPKVVRKKRRKLRVCLNIQDSDCAKQDTEDIFELELFETPQTNLTNDNNNNTSSLEDTLQPILEFINASEICYLSHYWDENFDLSPSTPESITTTSFTEYFSALVCSPPVIVQSPLVDSLEETDSEPQSNLQTQSPLVESLEEPHIEPQPNFKTQSPLVESLGETHSEPQQNFQTQSPLVELLEETHSEPQSNFKPQSPLVEFPLQETNSEPQPSSKTHRKPSLQSVDADDTADKENQPHSPPSNFLAPKTESQTNESNILQPLQLETNNLPLLSTTTTTLGSSTTTTEPSCPSSTAPPSEEPVHQHHHTSSHHKRSSRSHHHHSRSSKKHILTAIRLPGDSESDLPSPTKRCIRPYQKKSRRPIKLIMDSSENLNYAGEPETLSPHKRDDIKEKDILIWIYNMIDEAARVDYEFFLKDGCILCNLMNRVQPGCIPEDQITWEGARSKRRNVANFLSSAEAYGVPKGKLFFPEDLLHLRHIPRVTRCIYALAKIAQEDPALGPDCPQLGDEPNFAQPAKKVDIPGHRDTKEVLNQITATMAKKEETKKTEKHSLYK